MTPSSVGTAAALLPPGGRRCAPRPRAASVTVKIFLYTLFCGWAFSLLLLLPLSFFPGSSVGDWETQVLLSRLRSKDKRRLKVTSFAGMPRREEEETDRVELQSYSTWTADQ